ncbi:hypothetical protein PBRA_002051 [Plasmodiophora brassicae]|uniref:Uncharacterized protein n=1 Tax=Plasmodiophora brassicae TaxID=37360 RepID=A0A0G4J1I6_PLABS|nr:hypothetical protein PBRA_002051 [Plasmodiophora brassicae]
MEDLHAEPDLAAQEAAGGQLDGDAGPAPAEHVAERDPGLVVDAIRQPGADHVLEEQAASRPTRSLGGPDRVLDPVPDEIQSGVPDAFHLPPPALHLGGVVQHMVHRPEERGTQRRVLEEICSFPASATAPLCAPATGASPANGTSAGGMGGDDIVYRVRETRVPALAEAVDPGA